jgi:mono/diheme cytochrome c family protein
MIARSFVLALAMSMSAASAADSEPLSQPQQRGRELFNQSCVFCHGERGHATTLLGKRLGAEDALLERRTNLSPDLIKFAVRRGINSMPVYRRAELTDDELVFITAYLTRTRPTE